MNRLAMFELLAGSLVACLAYAGAERAGFDMPSVLAGVALTVLTAWSMFAAHLLGQSNKRRR